jgi:hypothetical protein
VQRTGELPHAKAAHFTCPHCAVDAQQNWEGAQIPPVGGANTHIDAAVLRSTCVLCEQRSYWIDGDMVWPEPKLGPPPSVDLAGEHHSLYEEARTVAPRSPRAAAALLRLLLEQLVFSLDTMEGTFNDKVDRLAHEGVITRRVVDALDAVRVGGRHAVHGGQIDPSGGDDAGVVLMLFTIVNTIIESAVTLPRETQSFLGSRVPSS